MGRDDVEQEEGSDAVSCDPEAGGRDETWDGVRSGGPAVSERRFEAAELRRAFGSYPTGVTVVSGFAGHQHLSWSEIERIRVHERRRFGARCHRSVPPIARRRR